MGVGEGNGLGPVDNQKASGLSDDPGEARGHRVSNGGWADRGQVDPRLVARLARLGQNPPPAARPATQGGGQAGDPPEQGVGAFLCLDRQDQALATDRGLADIESADHPGDGEGALYVGKVIGQRRMLPGRTVAQQKAAHDLMGALDPESLLLELAEKVAQKVPVTAAGGGENPRKGGQSAQIGFEVGQIRPLDIARETDRLATGAAQGRDPPAKLGQADILAVEPVEFRPGEPAQPDDEERPTARLAMVRQGEG